MSSSIDKYNIASNIAEIGIVFTDIDGIIVDMNEFIQKLTAQNIDEWKDSPIWGFEYNLLADKNKIQRSKHTDSIKKIIAKKSQKKNRTSRCIINDKNGKEIYLERTFEYILNGEKEYFVVVYKNIQSTILLENDLQYIENNLSEVLNYSRTIHYKQEIGRNDFIYISKYIEKLLGYTLNELTSFNIDDYSKMIHEDDIELFKSAYSEHKDYPVEIQYRIKDKQGRYKYLSDFHRVIFDENNQPKYLIGNLRDISLQKKFEEELNESREHYKIIVENINDLVVKVDNLGRILYASPNYCKLFNETLEDLVGKKYIYLVHEEDRDATEKAVEKLFSPPHTCYIEQRAWTTFGWRWLAWSDRAILDDDGNVAEIIGVGRDITKRKRMEEAVKKSEMDYKGLFENAMSAIIIFEPKNEIILDANKVACELYGFEKDEFIGMSIQYISKDVSRGRKEINNTFNVKKNHKFETVHFNKNREELFIEVNASLINFADVEAILSINKDISYLKKLENDLDETKKINEIIFDALDRASLFIDNKYNIYNANKSAANLFGYPKDNLDQMNFSQLLSEDAKIKLANIYNTEDESECVCEFKKSSSKKFNAKIKIRKVRNLKNGFFNIEFNQIIEE